MPKVVRQRLLSQRRPGSTGSCKLYSPATNVVTRITSVFFCNTNSAAVGVSLYLDSDGTTYSEDTALYSSLSVSANTTQLITFTEEAAPILDNSSGSLACQASTSQVINVTVFGIETTET